MDIHEIYHEWLTSFLEFLPKILSAIVLFIGRDLLQNG